MKRGNQATCLNPEYINNIHCNTSTKETSYSLSITGNNSCCYVMTLGQWRQQCSLSSQINRAKAPLKCIAWFDWLFLSNEQSFYFLLDAQGNHDVTGAISWFSLLCVNFAPGRFSIFSSQSTMVYCTAFNCNNDGKKMKSLSFFQFPSDEKYRQIWIEKVRRVNWEPNKYSRLCSAHFESHCFVHNFKLFDSLGLPRPKKATLKHDAIPTIFDYEDRTPKASNELTFSRKRKQEDSSGNAPWKGRKILEVPFHIHL